MNKLDFAIIQDYWFVKMCNECEELTTEQIEALNKNASEAWENVKSSDCEDLTEKTNIYTYAQNKINYVLTCNNLNFDDYRCKAYLLDSVYERFRHI